MTLQSLCRGIITPFKDFVFPPLCFLCGARLSSEEVRVCGQCWSSIRPVRRDEYTLTVLLERFAAGGAVDDFHAAYYFEEQGSFQKIVHSLKYDAMTVFGVELGMRLGKILLAEPGLNELDAVVPIPLHKSKLRERGYNQSESICEGIARVLRRPVAADLIRRSKRTVSQTHLSAEERRSNVGDAFEVGPKKRERVAGSRLLLVDDVITTGSTIESAARTLKEAGASKVVAASAGLAMLDQGGKAA